MPGNESERPFAAHQPLVDVLPLDFAKVRHADRRIASRAFLLVNGIFPR